MKEILQSCPSSPGARVIVTDKVKHRILPPGSRCFIAKYSGIVGLSPNMAVVELVTIKNGKRGRDRTDRVTVVTTLFPIEFEKRPLKSDRYMGTPIVELAPVSLNTLDVLDLEPMEFIGWAFAYKLYMRDLYGNAGIQNRWPNGKGQPVNGFNNISYRIAKTHKETLEFLGAPAFRLPFVEQLRALEAGVTQYILGERTVRTREKLEAIAYLITTEEKHKKGFYDPGQLKKTYSHYKALFDAEQDLYYQKRKMIPSPKNPKKPVTAETLLKVIRATVSKGKRVYYDRVIFNDK